MLFRIQTIAAEETDVTAKVSNFLDLRWRRALWHEYDAVDTEFLRSARDGRAVIAARRSNTTALALFVRECQQPIAGAAEFERSRCLAVFEFEPDICIQLIAERRRANQRRVLHKG